MNLNENLSNRLSDLLKQLLLGLLALNSVALLLLQLDQHLLAFDSELGFILDLHRNLLDLAQGLLQTLFDGDSAHPQVVDDLFHEPLDLEVFSLQVKIMVHGRVVVELFVGIGTDCILLIQCIFILLSLQINLRQIREFEGEILLKD